MKYNTRRSGCTAACLVLFTASIPSLAQSDPASKPADPKPADTTPTAPAAPAPSNPQPTASASTTPAATSPPASHTTGADPKPVTVYVVAVEGRVSVRPTDSPDAKSTLLKGGEQLPEGVEFSVGLKSAIRIRVADHQVFTFDQMGKINLRRALKDRDTNVTRLSMTSGRVSFDVDSTKSTNDVRIETPEMTLAIKGTSGAVEVRPGFGTRAFGDVENTGRIEVDWHSGITAVMTRSESTDSLSQDPAQHQNALTSVDTPKVESRDKDEKRLLKRTTSSKQDVQLSVGKTKGPGTDATLIPPTPPPPPPVIVPSIGSLLHFDASLGDLYETSPAALSSAIIRPGFPVDPTAATGGAAIIHDPPMSSLTPATGIGRLIYLESSTTSPGVVRNRFSESRLDRLADQPRVIGQFIGDSLLVPSLTALGAIGPTLYASGSIGDRSALYRVDLARGELVPSMDLGTAFHGALGGANSRGSLFAVIHDPGAAPTYPLLSRSAIVELDPRSNFLAAAYTGLDGALAETSGTSNSTVIELASLQALTGLAAVDGGILITAVSDTAGGRSVFLRYDTIAGAAHLTEVRNLPQGLTHGLASERAGSVPTSLPLTNPVGAIDRTTISAAFAGLGYSQQALNSGLVERLVKRQVVAGASRPDACAASMEIGALRTYLQSHVAQTAGVGRAVADFHASLPPGHPCD